MPAVARRDGSLQVKIIKHSPGELRHGQIMWRTVDRTDSVTIFACTPMEETLVWGLGL